MGISTISNADFDHSEAFDVQNANSVLVVGVYLEASAGSVMDIDFGGQSADGYLQDGRGALFYFLNPTTTADTIDFTHNGSNGGGIVVWELAGVDLSAPVAVPEPGSLALLGLGGLCVLRRRRG